MTGFTVFLLMICEPAGSIFARPDFSLITKQENNSLTFTSSERYSQMVRPDHCQPLAMELPDCPLFTTFGEAKLP